PAVRFTRSRESTSIDRASGDHIERRVWLSKDWSRKRRLEDIFPLAQPNRSSGSAPANPVRVCARDSKRVSCSDITNSQQFRICRPACCDRDGASARSPIADEVAPTEHRPVAAAQCTSEAAASGYL